MLFELHAVERLDNSKKVILYYDNYKNYFTKEKPLEFIDKAQEFKHPLKKSVVNEDTSLIKIMLGYACNYTCDYCFQKHLKIEKRSKEELDNLIAVLKNSITVDTMVQFWGGEPLLYFEDIKYIVQNTSLASFSIVTNGSLFTDEIIDFFIKYNFSIGISHDGPRQDVRSKTDFLNSPEHIRLIDRLKQNNIGFSFNSTLSGENFNKGDIVEYFQQKTKYEDVRIGEGMFVRCGSKEIYNSMKLKDTSDIDYRLQFINDFTKEDTVDRYNQVIGKLHKFIDSSSSESISEINPCNACSSKTMIVDTKLNLFSCQNFGNTAAIGKLTKDGPIESRVPSSSYRDINPKCQKCPVIHICGMGCPLSSDEELELNCSMYFNESVSLFFQAIKDKYDCILYKINSLEAEEEEAEDNVYILGELSHKMELFCQKTSS